MQSSFKRASMTRLRYYYSVFFDRMPYPVRVILNILIIPFLFVGIIIYSIRSTLSQSQTSMMSLSELKEQIEVPFSRDAPERDFVHSEAAKLLQAIDVSDWSSVEALLLDFSEQKTPAGYSAINHVREETWHRMLARVHLRPDDEISIPNDPRLDQLTAPFEEAVAQNPDSWMLRCAASDALCETAWMARGCEYVHATSENALTEMSSRFSRAQDYLDGVPEHEQNNPLVLRKRLSIAYGHASSTKEILSQFDTWFAADDSDFSQLIRLGYFLMPRWYGDLELIDETARIYFARSHKRFGATAYSMIYLEVLEECFEDEGNPWRILDPDLFCDGIFDWIKAGGDEQLRINVACSWLLDLSNPTYSPMGQQNSETARKQKVLRQAFFHLVRTRLVRVYSDLWSENKTDIIYALAEAYEQEIVNGEKVVIGEHKTGTR